jgi:hypothetical protein
MLPLQLIPFFLPFFINMFTRLINSIRETIARNPNNRANNNNKHSEHYSSSEYSSDSRRPSVTEELQNVDKHGLFSNNTNALGRSNTIATTSPISIDSSAPEINEKRRRSSTLFGISNVTYDDYVQKDLISSSWS